MTRAARRAVRRAWEDLGDRFDASDPGLIRLSSACTIVGGVLLTLLVLGPAGTSVWMMVAGALCAIVAGFGISDSRPGGQAVTLACALPVGLLSLTLGVLLAPYRVVADAVFLLLIFAGVYVRRYGPRGNGLGEFTFQLFFVAQFARVTPGQLPQMCAVVVVALVCSGLVRWALVRATPRRTVRRLRRAFRARLGSIVDAMADVAGAEPGSPAADRASVVLHRRIALLHRCALMIQDRLETGIEDPGAARLVQRRVAEAEIAAERLAVRLLRALRPQQDGLTTLTLHLPTLLRNGPGRGAAELVDPGRTRLIRELRELRLLVAHSANSIPPADAAVRDRLLGYREDGQLPAEATGAMRDVYRGMGELARAVADLRSVRDGGVGTGSRREMSAEDHPLRAGEAAATEAVGLRRPSTRAALQVTVGSAMAIAGGELLSPAHWYWALLACWVVFVNTSSVGDVLVKGYRRLAGTMAGAVAGIGLAVLVAGHTWTAFALMIACMFGAFFTASVSYLLMSSMITAMVGLLYTLLGSYSSAVLVVRIEETALGAVCGLAAALLVLPARTRHRSDEQLVLVLRQMREVITQAVAQLTGRPHTDLLDTARDLDTELDAFRTAIQPLIHPASPLRNRRSDARYVLAVLETCAYHVRSLAALAELAPGNPHGLAASQFSEAGRRLRENLCALADFVQSGGRTQRPLENGRTLAAPDHDGRPGSHTAGVAQALCHLHRIDESILGMARPLGLPTAPTEAPGDAPARPRTVPRSRALSAMLGHTGIRRATTTDRVLAQRRP